MEKKQLTDADRVIIEKFTAYTLGGINQLRENGMSQNKISQFVFRTRGEICEALRTIDKIKFEIESTELPNEFWTCFYAGAEDQEFVE